MTGSRPRVIVFDVNETLSDMAPMGKRFTEVGAPAATAKIWFASLLRDGFALAAAGDNRPFAAIGAEALRGMLAGVDLDRSLDEAVEHVLAGMAELPVHADVPAGIQRLSGAGYRLVTLSNGSTRVAEQLFTGAGIRDHFEKLLSVEDAPSWKPGRGAYEYAASACGVPTEDMLLVASHPWDLHGAQRADLRTAWINRTGAAYPSYFLRPGFEVASLAGLVSALDTGS